jgi:hypothetical protein
VLCTITPTLLNGNRAFLTFQSTTATQSTNGSNANIRCRLNSLTDVVCERGGSGTNVVNIRWSVAEFPNNVVTQTLATACTGDTTNVTLPQSVVRAESFVLISGERNVGNQDDNVSRLAELTSTTQAQIRKTGGCNNGDTNNLQVVHYPGSAVQRGVTSIGSGALTASAGLSPAVALDRSILLYSYYATGTGNKICDRGLRGELTNTTTVSFSRGEGDTANCSGMALAGISWEVVQFPVGTVVQQITQPLLAASASTSITLTQAVEPSRTLVIAGGQWASGQVHGEGRYSGSEIIDEMRARAVLTDSTHVSLTRESSLNTAKFTIFVVQLKP